MLQIEKPAATPRFALFQLGFRPFFAGAALFGIVAVFLWMLVYVFGQPLVPLGLDALTWHGHEMVFGYTLAVVAGFLLTAVVNWTGQPSLKGASLAMAWLLWLTARVALYLPEGGLIVAAVADLAFLLTVTFGVARPIFRVRQWKQVGILSKLVLLLIASGTFYAGALGHLAEGVRWGLFGAFYVVLALVFMMARRVMPFFIERGVDEAFTPRNRRWLDIASLFGVLIWALFEIFWPAQETIIALLSLGLFLMHALRLVDWHTPGIWRKPLLWSLYLGYASLTLGFALRILSVWGDLSPFLALHAFAYGGIGMMTLGMMSRVSLGHTGRNVFQPPRIINLFLLLLALGTVTRVLAPLIDMTHYTLWIGVSQVLWMAAFGLFAWVYVPMLIRPRIDGRPG
ncbi:MAG: NnrS family protein [Gammaproteobacteria bacterium]|nr:MAG: NnrS family protein [Gammaproteobacteria bacterium]